MDEVYYSLSDHVIAKIGDDPKCYYCGREAKIDLDGIWRCPECEKEYFPVSELKEGNQVKDQDYYTRNGYKAKDIIKDLLTYLDLDSYQSWIVGNVLKYICRYPFKGNRNQDISKAQEYLEWLKIKD